MLAFIWISICIDIFFVFFCGITLSSSIDKQSWGWAVWNFFLLMLWMHWFLKDTEKLKEYINR